MEDNVVLDPVAEKRLKHVVQDVEDSETRGGEK